MLPHPATLLAIVIAAAAAASAASAAAADDVTHPAQPWGRRFANQRGGSGSSVGVAPVSPPLPTKPPTNVCHGGLCGGMAHYPVAPGNVFYSEMDVPAYPKKLDGITYFIYFNIFFPGKGDGRMNQFVPQLMLGEPLCNSTGPPLYKPLWEHHATWVFGSQYFMEINNHTSNHSAEGHAATGDLYEAKVGEILYTRFDLSTDWVWTLTMGVKGDKTRVSTVVATQPYMGLVLNSTKNWSEPEFSKAVVNSCWELYGIKDIDHFPATGGTNDMRITTKTAGSIPWQTNWNALLENGGCANASITEKHSDTRQDVLWTVDKSPFYNF